MNSNQAHKWTWALLLICLLPNCSPPKEEPIWPRRNAVYLSLEVWEIQKNAARLPLLDTDIALHQNRWLEMSLPAPNQPEMHVGKIRLLPRRLGDWRWGGEIRLKLFPHPKLGNPLLPNTNWNSANNVRHNLLPRANGAWEENLHIGNKTYAVRIKMEPDPVWEEERKRLEMQARLAKENNH